MSLALKTTQQTELTLDEVLQKYPEFPRLVALKIDVQRRGVLYSDAALARVDPKLHQLRTVSIFGSRDGQIKPLPDSLMLRDGSSIVVGPSPIEANPYRVDVVDEVLVLVDRGQVLEEVDFWYRPKFFDKETSSGIPMAQIATARPQRLNLLVSQFCHFWAEEGGGCKYCDIVTFAKEQKKVFAKAPERPKARDVAETVREALKEKGRYTTFCITGGSVLKGDELFDHEVDTYVETLQAIGENFTTRKFPSQIVASAFNERQLRRLHEETGLTSYTSDIEVLNERLFKWICQGKAKHVGYAEWKSRLRTAVGIFGRGNVNTGIVGGVELAKPLGFTSEDEALTSTLEAAEELVQDGVSVIHTVWVPRPGSYFADQTPPSLEYYVRLADGLQALRRKYGLRVDFDDYRRCGNHPDTDLARLS